MSSPMCTSAAMHARRSNQTQREEPLL
jgi:hypothetical protein